MKLAVLGIALGAVKADIYLASPKGSNNRLDDENRDRNNGNRLFDSQNNNRGGSNVGNMVYYAGSNLRVEWSSQHSCNNPNNHCEIIFQYMCDDRLRDGTTTKTIPENPVDCYNMDCDTDVRYGRHESFEYYKHCKNRERNKGLFTSSQNLNGHTARYTRQNPNGARRGYECPEERDYYPYWQPTPWRDLFILTNDVSRCDAYKAESQNVKNRTFCNVPAYDFERYKNIQKKKSPDFPNYIPIDSQEDCEKIHFDEGDYEFKMRARWTEGGAWNIPPPQCAQTTWSRDNHHGNVEGGYFTSFNITIPDIESDQCVMRIRYNITTKDFPHFEGRSVTSPKLTAENNKHSTKKKNTDPANYNVTADYGIATTEAARKMSGYYLANNPQVDPFYGLRMPAEGDGQVKLQLAINTAQYGRTFEDRTHRFAVRKRPAELEGKNIYNLEVKGKRGNIVQTFPGTEYEFSPQRLYLRQNDDYVHFQWTGSNTNPNNNAGQGRQGSDRSNIVLMEAKRYDEPQPTDVVNKDNLATYGHYGNSYPADITKTTFLGLDNDDLTRLALAINTPEIHASGEMSELDDASTYFNLGPRKCSAKGIFHYLSTRNNNFSNRSQKGTIICGDYTSVVVGASGAKVTEAGWGEVSFASSSAAMGSEAVIQQTAPQAVAGVEDIGGSVSGEVLTIRSETPYSLDSIPYSRAGLVSTYVYFRPEGSNVEWEEYEDSDCSGGMCSINNASGDMEFVIIQKPNGGAIFGVVLLVLGVVGAAGFFGMKYKRNKELNGSVKI
jgi:hypothetical protein